MRSRLLHAVRRPLSSLSNQMLLSSLVLIIFPLVIVGVFSYNTYSRYLERATDQYSLQILDKLKEQTDDLFTQLDDSITTLWVQPDLQELAALPPDEWKDNPSIIYSLSKYISNLYGWREGNKGLFIVTDLGGTYHELTTSPVKENYPFQQEAFFQESRTKRKMWITGPHPQNYVDGDPVISINRPLLRSWDFEWKGAIRYDMSADQLLRLFESTRLGSSGYFMVVDGSGKVVYQPDRQVAGITAQISAVSGNRLTEGNFPATVGGVKYLVAYVTLASTDWKLIGVVPWSEIVQGADKVRRSMIVIGCLTLLACVLIVLRLNGILLKPLFRLNRAIRKLGSGDFSSRIPIPPVKELQSVAEQYNRTVDQLRVITEELYISKLRQQETELSEQAARMKQQETELRMREAELSQLQAQINPHFLYNTLSCIDSMAEAEGALQIRQAVGQLSRMFRYSIYSGRSMVPLPEEIAHVQSFVTIQRLRYEERIRVTFSISDEAKTAFVHRLTLQPLVENAYFHGLEPKLGGGRIRIGAEVDGMTLQLEVEDDGVGMKAETLRALQRFVGRRGAIETAERLSGIENVFRRLYLAYGDACRIFVDSREMEGTQIRVRLPYRLSD